MKRVANTTRADEQQSLVPRLNQRWGQCEVSTNESEGQARIDQSEAEKLTGIPEYSTRWFQQLHIELCQSPRREFQEWRSQRLLIKGFVILYYSSKKGWGQAPF